MIQKIKQLKGKINHLNEKIKVADKHIEGKRKAYEKSVNFKENLEHQLRGAERELEKANTNNELVVSDHSLIRYLERVNGIDMESLRKEIVTEELKTLHQNLGNGKFPLKDGGKAVIKDGVIVSIV